jgi:DNA-binding response OmpR family regulator
MKRKILVVDDDAEWLALVETGLGLDGFTVLTAGDKDDGRRKALEFGPDVIVLDITMWEMDEWSADRPFWNVGNKPIIILGALESKKDVMQWLSWKGAHRLIKPCAIGELSVHILAALREHGSALRRERSAISDPFSFAAPMRSGV